jgi:ribonucleoside-diphosphate reductase alpha chain/ribonucleoside-triphosphate reductase
MRLKNAGPGGLGSRDRWILSIRHFKEENARYISNSLKKRGILRSENLWLDPIEGIEKSECETYDIEVEEDHHYLISGVVSHNTISLLAGVSSGCHPALFRYYIRRVRIAANDPLVDVCRSHGFHIEPLIEFGKVNHDTVVVEFPCKASDHAVLASEMKALDELEVVKRLQTEWSDNSVSCTVYYRPHELPDIREWLRSNFTNCVKSVSFLLQYDHGFAQAPNEEITKEKYEELCAKCRPITNLAQTFEDESVSDCIGGSCPIK